MTRRRNFDRRLDRLEERVGQAHPSLFPDPEEINDVPEDAVELAKRMAHYRLDENDPEAVPPDLDDEETRMAEAAGYLGEEVRSESDVSP